jgi:AAA domain
MSEMKTKPASHEPSDELNFRPWSELLTMERRELLVDELLFSTGVTTLVAPSGQGKTTFAASIGFTVGSGGVWGGKLVRARPVLWVIGEDKHGLKGMYEAWLKDNPGARPMEGAFHEEPINLSSELQTNKLIARLAGKPPHLIITDALADMIGDADENSSKDMNRFYRNVWRVVNVNDAAFMIPHHTGWNTEREKGSHAIRAKSDIIPQITKFDPGAGFIQLQHNKRRGGAKLKEFCFEVKLIPVAGYGQPIPIVTGKTKSPLETILNQKPSENEVHARTLVRIMVECFPEEGATSTELEEKSGMSNTTFKRGLGEARGRNWFVGGGGKGIRYLVNPDGCWREAVGMKTVVVNTIDKNFGIGAMGPPLKGGGPNGPNNALGPPDPMWTQSGPGPNNSIPAESHTQTEVDLVEKPPEPSLSLTEVLEQLKKFR